MILHVDLNAFYANCAVVDSGGRYTFDTPLMVAGDPAKRHGIILAATYPVKRLGVRAGMALWEAKALCPQAVVVPPTYHRYMEVSNAFMRIISGYSPLIMRYGIDEAYLDYSGCERIFGLPQEAAETIRRRVKEELRLTVSVGVGDNMIRAKMGSDYKKPDTVTYLDEAAWRELIWPKPVENLMYVGWATAKRLHALGIGSIERLARTSPQLLKSVFGKAGGDMWLHANGMDDQRIASEPEPQKGIGHSMTLQRDFTRQEDLLRGLLFQTERVAFRLRESGMRARVVAVSLRYSDLQGESRQITLASPTDITQELYRAGSTLMEAMLCGKPVRQLGIRVGKLTAQGEQLGMFGEEGRERQRRLDRAVDEIRRAYGPHAVMRGGTMQFEYDEKEDFTPFARV